MSEEKTNVDDNINHEIITAANKAIASWLTIDLAGIQFLKNSNWKIDEEVFLNSAHDSGYLLLLNQYKDTKAELDYIQILIVIKEEGQWKTYLPSLPSLLVPRKKEHEAYEPNSLNYLSEIGKREINRNYKNSDGVINDDLINQEYIADLKNDHQLFLTRTINQ